METRNFTICQNVILSLMENNNILIRNCCENDAKQVHELLRVSWKDAYSSFIPQQYLDEYLENKYSVEKLGELFLDLNNFCFAAEKNSDIVAWLKLFDNKIENKFYLSSIYVLTEAQHLKIGKQLMELSFRKAMEKGYKDIWVGVMKQNTKALAWYKSSGFVFSEELPFTMGEASVPHFIGKKSL